jgi:hypothetical protein
MTAENATIVLVHGAWADGSCWQNIIRPLKGLGLNVTCAPIPLTSLTDDIAALSKNTRANQQAGRAGWARVCGSSHRRAHR